jgi:hypothetical protein
VLEEGKLRTPDVRGEALASSYICLHRVVEFLAEVYLTPLVRKTGAVVYQHQGLPSLGGLLQGIA